MIDPPTLMVVRADWQAPAHVHALSTTRLGGVSQPPFDALNVGLHVGDDPESVHRNRARMQSVLALPTAPRWLHQVHGVNVVNLDAETGDARSSGGADGAWTDAAATVVAIMTADCLPVVVTDDAGTRVAACHAGWRGLASGVLDSTLNVFPLAASLHAWLGPAIGPLAFEVGGEVREAFVELDSTHAEAFRPAAEDGQYLADIYALARRIIARSGRTVRVSGGDHCTVTEASHFHSHRRDGARSGRMATLIWRD